MSIFKESKHQPIKFRGFKFIGVHKDYPNACYYYKKLDRGNYELMECMLEGAKKPEVGAGTTVKILDTFMSTYLENLINNEINIGKDLVADAVHNHFYDMKDEDKKGMIDKFSSKIPKEIGSSKLFKKYKDAGYDILYCSNDESADRLFGVVNIVFVKEENLKSNHEKINIDRNYTLFKPLRFSVSPNYLKGQSTRKYLEMDLNEIRVDHDILAEM